ELVKNSSERLHYCLYRRYEHCRKDTVGIKTRLVALAQTKVSGAVARGDVYRLGAASRIDIAAARFYNHHILACCEPACGVDPATAGGAYCPYQSICSIAYLDTGREAALAPLLAAVAVYVLKYDARDGVSFG